MKKRGSSEWATFCAVIFFGLFATILPARANAGSDPLQCLNGGYLGYVNAQGQRFASAFQCFAFVISGGNLTPAVGDYNISVTLTNKTGATLDITTKPVYSDWNCASGGAGVTLHFLPDATLEETATINQSGICSLEYSQMTWDVSITYQTILGPRTTSGLLVTQEGGLGAFHGFENSCYFNEGLIKFFCDTPGNTHSALKASGLD